MLYHLLLSFYPQVPLFNVVRYITFRTAAASITALFISLVLGPWLIRRLRVFQIGQVIRHEGPQSHQTKAGTPTMGGLLILAASLVPTLLWVDLTNVYVWIAVLSTAAFGAIGFLDDYLKVTRRSSAPLSGSFGTTRIPPRFSWATWDRWRSAPRSALWRFSSSRNCCW